MALLATDPQYLGEEGYSPADLSGVVAMSGMYELPTLVQYPNALGLGQGDVVLYRGMLATAFGSTRYADLAPPSPQLRLGGYRMPMRVIYSDGDVPGLEQEAAMYVQVAQGIDPSVPIDLCGIAYEDYDPTTWEQAISLAADTEVLGVPLLAGAPGHFAEVLAIRPEEPDSYPTRLVVDFINRH